MDRVEFELTKEQYVDLMTKTYAEIDKFVLDQLDASVIHGYGYYGHGNPFKRDGKYYLSYKVGSSCD